MFPYCSSVGLFVSQWLNPPDVPKQRLEAITFVVVNRFSKTRRISRALAVAHPWVRGAYLAPPASFSSGLRPALVRCQVAQGPRSRAGFAARGGGGGVGMVLGRASARWMYVRLPACDMSDFLLSHDEGRLSQNASALDANFYPQQRIVCHHAMSCRRALHD